MSVIQTQQEFQRCRSRLRICYLCGKPLDNSGQTSREHIVPQAALGRCASSNDWPAVVDVHHACECDMKRPLDGVYVLFQRFIASAGSPDCAERAMNQVIDRANSSGTDVARAAAYQLAADAALAAYPANVARMEQMISEAMYRYIDTVGISNKEKTKAKADIRLALNPQQALNSGHYRRTSLKPIDEVKVNGLPLPPDSLALDGFHDVMSAVWTWIRGFHTTIYGEYLPRSAAHNLWTPDFRCFRGISSPQEITPDGGDCDIIQHWLHVAELTNKMDGVRCWGEACNFRCAWVTSEVVSHSRCLWCLAIPGVSSWYGWYNTSMPTDRARVLAETDRAIAYERFKSRTG